MHLEKSKKESLFIMQRRFQSQRVGRGEILLEELILPYTKVTVLSLFFSFCYAFIWPSAAKQADM